MTSSIEYLAHHSAPMRTIISIENLYKCGTGFNGRTRSGCIREEIRRGAEPYDGNKRTVWRHHELVFVGHKVLAGRCTGVQGSTVFACEFAMCESSIE